MHAIKKNCGGFRIPIESTLFYETGSLSLPDEFRIPARFSFFYETSGLSLLDEFRIFFNFTQFYETSGYETGGISQLSKPSHTHTKTNPTRNTTF